jgi:hypothetical protein
MVASISNDLRVKAQDPNDDVGVLGSDNAQLNCHSNATKVAENMGQGLWGILAK